MQLYDDETLDAADKLVGMLKRGEVTADELRELRGHCSREGCSAPRFKSWPDPSECKAHVEETRWQATRR